METTVNTAPGEMVIECSGFRVRIWAEVAPVRATALAAALKRHSLTLAHIIRRDLTVRGDRGGVGGRVEVQP
tara:strand:- start:831 stop:1046 length:216 start_codon:yes stop_codon:yes gene_type:complete